MERVRTYAKMRLLASVREYINAHTTHTAEPSTTGTFQPYPVVRYATTVGVIAPPMFPHIFMTAAAEPAKSPAMSMGMAQETPTTNSKPPKARQLKATESLGSAVKVAGRIAAAAIRKPAIPTTRRARVTFPVCRNTRSVSQPPARSPTTPANKGRLEYTPIAARLNPRDSFK